MNHFLVLSEKCHELVSFGRVAVRQYPNLERFALRLEISESARLMHRYSIRIGKSAHKRKLLESLDEEIQIYRTLIYDSFSYGYINDKKYEAWSHRIAEIGRITGGWLEKIKAKELKEKQAAIASKRNGR